MADGSVKIDVRLDSTKAERELNKLVDKINKAETELNANAGKKNALAAEFEKTAAELDEAIRKTNELRETYNNSRGSSRAEIKPQLAEAVEEQRLLTREVNRLDREYIAVNKKIEQGTKNLEEMKEQAGQMQRQIVAAKPGEVIARSIEVGKKSLIRFLKYAFGIRSVFFLFRRLRSAIKEAVTTFAEYDTETKSSINGLKSALSTLKLSWGAAFAPILNAVAPILQRLIGWLTQAANAIQMFFAVLGGKSTYKAVKANEALASSYGGAGDAAEKAGKQLLGFDEINQLNDNKSSGGGGGGGSAGVSVEDVQIPQKTLNGLTFIKDHLDEILFVAQLVGAALAAWKISRFLGADFKVVFGWIVAIGGVAKFVKDYLDAWQNGINLDNLKGMILGLTGAFAGLSLAISPTAGAIALLIGAIAMLVLGIKDWNEQGELSEETFWLLETAIVAIGLAISVLTGNWIPLLIAAFAGITLAVYKNWDEIKGFFEKIGHFFSARIDEWKKVFPDDAAGLTAAIIFGVGEALVDGAKLIWDKLTGFWDDVKEWWGNLSLGSFDLKLPHLEYQLVTVPVLGTIPDPRTLRVNWYAKGGVVDGATLIGAGEAGKEAIVPLERNMQWINMVVDGMIDRLMASNRLADYVSSLPLPAVANGQLVPPKALSGGFGGLLNSGDIDRLASAIAAAINYTSDAEDNVTRIYLDGELLTECVNRHNRRIEMEFGL